MRNLRVERRRATLERRREDDGDGSHRVVGGAFDGERDAFHALTAVKRRDGDGEDIFVTTHDVATGAARVDRGRAPVEERSGGDVACAGAACCYEPAQFAAALVSGEFVAAATGRDGDDGARDDDDACDVVGEIPQGVVAFAWCPDGEVCAALTRDARVLVMTKDFYPLFESRDDDDDDDETTTLANGSISWRGDGRYFACSSTHARTNETTIKVWERERVVVESACETRTATSGTPATLAGAGRRGSPPLAWQPRGALIAAAGRIEGEDSDCVVFYERNGLRRGEFTLPRGDVGAEITSLAWSADSACLSVAVRYGGEDGDRAVQIWTRSNMHWYMKHETRYNASEGEARAEWDAERGDVLRTYTEKGTVERFDLFWETTTSDRGTCAVIDGDVVMLTPMFRTPMPPPLCAAKAVFSAPVVAAAFQPSYADRGERVVALCSTGSIESVECEHGTDWERAADDFADSERAATWSRWTDNEIPSMPRFRVDDDRGATVEFLAWIRDTHLVYVVRGTDDDDTCEMTIVPFDGDDDDASAKTIRVAPAVGALTSANGAVFAVTRRVPSETYVVDVADTASAGGEPFAEARLAALGVPTVNDEASFKIVDARGLDVGERYVDAFGAAPGAGVLVSLDARGTLRIGSVVVASAVTSFATHVSSADGCAVTTADASSAVAVAARDPTSWTPEATPSTRVVYVTKDHRMFVAEVDDVLADTHRREFSGARTGATEDDAHVGNWLIERSAADGARMGELAFSDLHTRMRRAMRPEAAKFAADAGTRQVEDGARVVACAPGATSVALQMPRGNLEIVSPKALVLPATACALRAKRYADAYALASKQRVDLNLIVDYGWPTFLSDADAFVADVRSADAVMELLEALDDGDVTAPGAAYAELARLYPPPARDASEKDAAAAAPPPDRKDKVQTVCAAIRRAIEKRGTSSDRWELATLTSYASGENPDLGSALRRVAAARQKELDGASSDASSPTSGGVDAAAALKHLLFLVGGKTLYSAALGTYDLSLAYLVAQHAQMDPGEYVAELQNLQNMREHERRADIARRLGKYEEAIVEYMLDADVDRAAAVAAEHKLFPRALAEAARLRLPDIRRALLIKHAEHLSESMRAEDAAVARLAAGDLTGALDEYRAGASWQQALALAGRLGASPNERRAIAEELCESVSLSDPLAAGRIAARHLRDYDRAVDFFAAARAWREASETAYGHDRGDLMETTIAPACAVAAEEYFESFKEGKARAEKYAARLRELRAHRARVAAAVSLGGADWSELGGRPRAGFGVPVGDDDAASEAPSLASDMSAYTDRTSATTAASATSAASTVGGRKAKKRKDKKKNNKRSGLRAGSPTEERDLALHVAGLEPSRKTLEEIGELLELMTLLGHEDDARSLQRVVGDSVDAHALAKKDAEATLKELIRRAEAKGEPTAEFELTRPVAPEWKWSLLRAA